MKNVQGRIPVALSSGLDSRLLLAVAQAAGVPFSAYTHTFPTKLVADRKLPPLLAKFAGVEHVYIDPAEEDQELLQAFDAHCGGQSVDADWKFFAQRQWAWTKPEDVLVRGLGFAIGMCMYYENLRPDPIPADALLRCFGAHEAAEYVQDSITEYLDWTSQTPIIGLDCRDRFYLEVRFAGWTSSMEQSLDIVDGVLFHPANARRIGDRVLDKSRRPNQIPTANATTL